jgi:hypothetical protein
MAKSLRSRPASRPWIVASAFAAAAGALVPGVAAQPTATRTSALNGRTVGESNRTLPDLAALGLALPEAPGPVRTYAIDEGPLADVLAAIGREAEVTVDMRQETVAGLTSPGVKGTFTLEQALADCAAAGITGAKITPFVLGRIAEATDGRSIPANLALAENNARVAAEVAVAIAG